MSVAGFRFQTRSSGKVCTVESLTPNEFGYIRVVYDDGFTVYVGAGTVWYNMVKVPDRPPGEEEY
jgi:hypothetical protein